MYKQLLGFYWTWRIYKNQCMMKDLQKLLLECQGYPELTKDVEKQVHELSYLTSQAELQLSKLNLWTLGSMSAKVVG